MENTKRQLEAYYQEKLELNQEIMEKRQKEQLKQNQIAEQLYESIGKALIEHRWERLLLEDVSGRIQDMGHHFVVDGVWDDAVMEKVAELFKATKGFEAVHKLYRGTSTMRLSYVEIKMVFPDDLN